MTVIRHSTETLYDVFALAPAIADDEQPRWQFEMRASIRVIAKMYDFRDSGVRRITTECQTDGGIAEASVNFGRFKGQKLMIQLVGDRR